MAGLTYPRDLPHPSGFRTVTVYSADEDRMMQAEFSEYRTMHQQAAIASQLGRPAPVMVDARVRAAADLQAEKAEAESKQAEFNAAVDAEVKRRLAAKGQK